MIEKEEKKVMIRGQTKGQMVLKVEWVCWTNPIEELKYHDKTVLLIIPHCLNPLTPGSLTPSSSSSSSLVIASTMTNSCIILKENPTFDFLLHFTTIIINIWAHSTNILKKHFLKCNAKHCVKYVHLIIVFLMALKQIL